MAWRCCMCNIGDHEACLGESKLCLCEECWVDEDSTEDEDE